MPIDDIYLFSIQVQHRIQKMSINYNSNLNNEADRQFIAEHFDLLDTGRSISNNWGMSLKQINPDLKIIGYVFPLGIPDHWAEYDTANDGTHEHWFIHDIYGDDLTHRIYTQAVGYKVYFMDPNPNLQPDKYSDFFKDRVVSYIQANPYTNGMFSDNTYKWLDRDSAGYSPGLSEYGNTMLERPLTFDDWPQDTLDNWADWAFTMIQNTQNALNTNFTIDQRMIMPNSWKWTDFFCQQITHIHFYENFIHGRSHEYNEPGYGSSYNYGLDPINWLHAQAVLGNIIAVNSGCKDANNHPVEAHDWMVFTLACFLLAVEDMTKAYYSWQFYTHDTSNGYYPEMDTNFGDPAGNYWNITGRVYAREFQNYYVATNLDPTVASIFILDGQNITLQPRRAVFLQKNF